MDKLAMCIYTLIYYYSLYIHSCHPFFWLHNSVILGAIWHWHHQWTYHNSMQWHAEVDVEIDEVSAEAKVLQWCSSKCNPNQISYDQCDWRTMKGTGWHVVYPWAQGMIELQLAPTTFPWTDMFLLFMFLTRVLLL
jgi:hypothetical protein